MVRLLALFAYSLASRLHPLFPCGRMLRARLARVLADSIASTANIEPGVKLSRGVIAHHKAGIGAGTWFLGQGRVELGPHLKMGPQCLFITNDHPVPPPDTTFDQQGGASAPIVVGRDVFIGARVVVLPGVIIGDGAAIGAGTVVTKDVPAGGICVGNPGKVVRVRGEAASSVTPTPSEQ